MTEESLLRRLLEDLHDRAPWLVLADWYEEFGTREQQARAEQMRMFVTFLDVPPLPGRLRVGAESLRGDQVGGLFLSLEATLQQYERLAANLFAAHPLLRVTLSDRKPFQGSSRDGWLWYGDREESGQDYPSSLPRRLWQLLRPGAPCPSPESRTTCKHFVDDASAHAALSDAAVALGRELAGLPPLR